MKKVNFAYYLMDFLTHYLPIEKGYSKNTISSYRYCFILMFNFFESIKNIHPKKLDFNDLSKSAIEDFLDWLEEQRNCSISTRNQRLAAINSFFIYVAYQSPDYLSLCQQISNIPVKKAPKPLIDYLSTDEIQALLFSPDPTTVAGFRNMVLLSLMYDTAARVQEICDITPNHLHLKEMRVQLTGKGQKSRIIPIMEKTSHLLKQYLEANHFVKNLNEDKPLFPNKYGKKMTRAGVTYILSKYVKMAKAKQPLWFCGNFHPHCLRHSRAMHMLESGVPLHYIRDFLGHESIITTEVYAKVNKDSLKNALAKAHNYGLVPDAVPSWQQNLDILSWLKSLDK